MATLAIISDIHGNAEALRTVLEDIDRRGIKRIVCLGDVIGYGPDPAACLDMIAERVEFCLCGNHDHAVFYEPFNFNLAAERAAFWTRQVFEDEPDVARRNRRWEFLGAMAIRMEVGDMLFVHGSPRKPINEYLFPDDVITNPQKLLQNFDRMEHTTCFVGHTHVPGVFVDDPYFEPPNELPEPRKFVLGDEKVIVNVGSVGQPRDRDPRASYVIVNDDQLEFIRIEYDIDTTVAKIQANPLLDDFLGARLREGR
ncbi:MAG: metallophosphoesterase family protein [Phycisphaerae bacterium]|nr:metallophosphatase family protein [Phycisphaerae bacterium]NUQ48016.1 metallophosphoesterase family protein [Phycisphaerae bacterium]